MFKKVFINNEETSYIIYDNGQLMNEKTGHYYKGSIRNGYRWFDLRWKNKKYSRSQHRLIAEAFISNPNNYELVHHINNNGLDNRLENLQWVDVSTNNLQENKKAPFKDYLDYDLSKEEWRRFRDTRYLISNLGRVKNGETNKILQGKITSGGYREWCLRFYNKRHSLLAHQAVWEVWGDNGNNSNVINHINGNKLDNRIINLESVTSQENNLKAIYETKARNYKKTASFDEEGNLIRIFENNADAARNMNVATQSIWYAIKHETKCCDLYWKNIEEV